MDRLDAITAFVAVARNGGFSAGSRALGIPVANVSRKVALLEEALGVRLLVRTTRHVALTDGGRRYLEACSRVLDDLKEADEEVSGEYRQPQGDLIITAPLGFGQKHLQPVVHAFLRAFPQVNVQLQLADRVVALVEEHVDCALRIGALHDSTLVARHLGDIRMVVCASPHYLAERGTPQDLADLQHHACLSWTALGPHKVWEFQVRDGDQTRLQKVPVPVRLSTTTSESALQAAIDGLGLVQATTYQVAPHVEQGVLVPVLQRFDSEQVPVNLVYPSKRLIPLKLRAFLDFAALGLEERLRMVAATFAAGSTVGATAHPSWRRPPG